MATSPQLELSRRASRWPVALSGLRGRWRIKYELWQWFTRLVERQTRWVASLSSTASEYLPYVDGSPNGGSAELEGISVRWNSRLRLEHPSGLEQLDQRRPAISIYAFRSHRLDTAGSRLQQLSIASRYVQLLTPAVPLTRYTRNRRLDNLAFVLQTKENCF